MGWLKRFKDWRSYAPSGDHTVPLLRPVPPRPVGGRLIKWDDQNGWVEITPKPDSWLKIHGLKVVNNQLYSDTSPLEADGWFQDGGGI